MNGLCGLRSSSLIPWCLHVSYHVDEFDSTESSVKWLNIHELNKLLKMSPAGDKMYFD